MGHSLSKEARIKISISSSRKRKPLSEETKNKISLANMGNTVWRGRKHTKKTIAKMRKIAKERGNFRTGKPVSIETRKKIGDAQRGNKAPNWKGGVTPINEKIRHSLEYRIWRTAVFQRDNYTCKECLQVGGKLNADHIKPFAYYPELRFDINNGRTLCIPCHRKTDTWGYRKRVIHLPS